MIDMIVKLLTEHHLEFLTVKGGYTGSSESTHVKMPHCWKSHATAHIKLTFFEQAVHLSKALLAGMICWNLDRNPRICKREIV